MRVKLPSELTIQLISDVKLKGSRFAIDQTLSQVEAKVQFLTSKDIQSWRDEVEIVKIPPIRTIDAYSEFMLRDLHRYMPTCFSLIIQWDGYVLDGSAWDPRFLDYDYIGAPAWVNHPWYFVPPVYGPVLNGGFSIRSFSLMQEISDSIEYQTPYEHEKYIPIYEDQYITRIYRKKLQEKGFIFAPPDLAERFSVENAPYEGQFGWHGTAYGPDFIHGPVLPN